MSLYYGRNYSNLKLNSEVEGAVVKEFYLALTRKLFHLVEDKGNHISPHGKEVVPAEVIKIINTNEERKLLNLIKKKKVSCRQTMLGFCLKQGACEYGGIESLVSCTSFEGKGICSDAIFDRKNEAKLLKLKKAHETHLEKLDNRSMAYSALKQEIHAIEVYQNVINTKEVS